MDTQPSHREIEELLGAYALDALEPDEAALVADHLTTCARCRAEVEEHREVAALLAHSGEPAPIGIWDRIASSLDATPPEFGMAAPPSPFTAPPSPFTAPPKRAGGRAGARSAWASRAGAGLLAAAASVVIAVLAFQVQALNEQVDNLERMTAVETVERGFESAAASDEATRVELASEETALDARAFLTADGTGYLEVDALPPLPDDRSYQLWGVTPDERIVSLAVFDTSTEYAAFSYAGEFVALAITEEIEGGVVASEQPALVQGEVKA